MSEVAQSAVAQDRIRKEETFHPILVTRVYKSEYQKEGTQTAELKQTVETKSFYPSKSVSSDLQDNPFDLKEFGFEESEYNASSVRVAWIDIPLDCTEEVAKAKIASLAKARLYRILSNHPIISDRQQYAIDNPIPGATTRLSIEVLGDRQAVRYPKDHPTNAGGLIMDTNGKPQFKAVFFRSTLMLDVDKRNEIKDDFYATPTMLEEMTGVVSQSLTRL